MSILRPADRTVRRDPPPALQIDVVTYLTVFLVLLYAFSARQALGFLGAIGTPAMLLALGAPLFWLAGRALPESGLARTSNSLHVAATIYLGYLVASVSFAALSRRLSPLEETGAMRGFLISVAMVGLTLLIADGVRSRSRLDTLLRRLVVVATLFSLLGIVQFLTGLPLQVQFPGMTWIHDAGGIAARGSFNRPRATAMHAIEYSVVTAALVPLALHFALYDTVRRRRRLATIAAIALVIAVPLGLSRSGVIAIVVALLVLAARWTTRRIGNTIVASVLILPFFWFMVPQLADTLVDLFTETDQDDSIQARLERIPRVLSLIRTRPWMGFGHGTYNLEDYFLLDNQVLVTTVESGLLGAALMITLVLIAIVAGMRLSAIAGVDETTAHLGWALSAAIAAMGISTVTFDAFHYRIFTGTLFLLIGCIGALYQQAHAARRDRHSPDEVHTGNRQGDTIP